MGDDDVNIDVSVVVIDVDVIVIRAPKNDSHKLAF